MGIFDKWWYHEYIRDYVDFFIIDNLWRKIISIHLAGDYGIWLFVWYWNLIFILIFFFKNRLVALVEYLIVKFGFNKNCRTENRYKSQRNKRSPNKDKLGKRIEYIDELLIRARSSELVREGESAEDIFLADLIQIEQALIQEDLERGGEYIFAKEGEKQEDKHYLSFDEIQRITITPEIFIINKGGIIEKITKGKMGERLKEFKKFLSGNTSGLMLKEASEAKIRSEKLFLSLVRTSYKKETPEFLEFLKTTQTEERDQEQSYHQKKQVDTQREKFSSNNLEDKNFLEAETKRSKNKGERADSLDMLPIIKDNNIQDENKRIKTETQKTNQIAGAKENNQNRRSSQEATQQPKTIIKRAL